MCIALSTGPTFGGLFKRGSRSRNVLIIVSVAIVIVNVLESIESSASNKTTGNSLETRFANAIHLQLLHAHYHHHRTNNYFLENIRNQIL